MFFCLTPHHSSFSRSLCVYLCLHCGAFPHYWPPWSIHQESLCFNLILSGPSWLLPPCLVFKPQHLFSSSSYSLSFSFHCEKFLSCGSFLSLDEIVSWVTFICVFIIFNLGSLTIWTGTIFTLLWNAFWRCGAYDLSIFHDQIL